ncbi:unnamed protein product [Cyclocybe aegerita]|uniref:Uncharacterized protein n=1 Tax=Cyclocybe aegerita TaxID=1973307 RepID=A0A8S0XHY9_CYCAE|nr:unnamed protein product [Cyclocybe aegerita]
MRFFSVLSLACAVLQAVSAIPVSNPIKDPVAHGASYTSSTNTQHLEVRGRQGKHHRSSRKHKPPTPVPITFDKEKSPHAAHQALNNLNLHGKKRKAVEKYHKNVVAEHMKTVPGAHSAVIKNLAHSMGSRDPNVHISAVIKDKAGNIITAPRRGNPNIQDPTHHIYTNKQHPHDGYKPLPIEYKKAVDKKLKAEGKKPGRV